MSVSYKLLAISSFCAVTVGFAVSTLIINSENGYIGGMVFLPLFLLVILVGFILFIISLVSFGLNKMSLGISLFLSAILLPLSFILSCLIAKYFEIGAYRQQPMIPFPVVQ